MAEYRNQTLTDEIEVDGHVYVDCRFRRARLNYRGGEPPRFDNCAFEDSRFSFHDQAAQTLTFLRAMAPGRTGLRPVVLGMIPELTQD